MNKYTLAKMYHDRGGRANGTTSSRPLASVMKGFNILEFGVWGALPASEQRGSKK